MSCCIAHRWPLPGPCANGHDFAKALWVGKPAQPLLFCGRCAYTEFAWHRRVQ